MTPYIVLGNKNEASKTDLQSALQEMLDLADANGADREDILQILRDNGITFEV